MDADAQGLVAGSTTPHQMVMAAAESVSTLLLGFGIWLVGLVALVGVGLVGWWLAAPLTRAVLYLFTPFGVAST